MPTGLCPGRDDVASTFIQRHFGTKCPLGYVLDVMTSHRRSYNVILAPNAHWVMSCYTDKMQKTAKSSLIHGKQCQVLVDCSPLSLVPAHIHLNEILCLSGFPQCQPNLVIMYFLQDTQVFPILALFLPSNIHSITLIFHDLVNTQFHFT